MFGEVVLIKAQVASSIVIVQNVGMFHGLVSLENVEKVLQRVRRNSFLNPYKMKIGE